MSGVRGSRPGEVAPGPGSEEPDTGWLRGEGLMGGSSEEELPGSFSLGVAVIPPSEEGGGRETPGEGRRGGSLRGGACRWAARVGCQRWWSSRGRAAGGGAPVTGPLSSPVALQGGEAPGSQTSWRGRWGLPGCSLRGGGARAGSGWGLPRAPPGRRLGEVP